jgi:hypothetical protein
LPTTPARRADSSASGSLAPGRIGLIPVGEEEASMEAQPLNVSRPASEVGIVVRTMLRVVATITAVFTVYALMPGTEHMTGLKWTFFAVALGALAALIAFGIRSVLRAPHPALRAVEVMATVFPIFLTGFALTYLSMSQGNGQTFSQPLDHINALYFTVVTFATVGFGDIVPKTDAARLVVVAQIFLDLIFIGVVVRLLLGAVQVRIRPQLSRQP